MEYGRLSKSIRNKLESETITSTEIRTIAKEIGKDHELADHLWAVNNINHRLLAVLVMDKKQVSPDYLEALMQDVERMDRQEMSKLSDWLLANQLMYVKNIQQYVEGWIAESSVAKQRMFWSYCARIMRREKKVVDNAGILLGVLEKKMQKSDPLIQETMNWCAAEIGILDEALRDRCIHLGERLGLYKDYPVSKGCISPYLPEWIGAMAERSN